MNTQCLTGRLPANRPYGRPPVTVTASEAVPTIDLVYVRDQLAAVAATVPGSPLVRARLTVVPGAHNGLDAVVQANLQIDGWLIARAQVAATAFPGAGDLVAARVRDHLQRASNAQVVRPWPEPTNGRPEPRPLSASRREIRREKHIVPMSSDAVGAAQLMDVMDYDFHLFVDSDTGEDSVVYRVGPTGYRLARLENLAFPSAPGGVRWTVNVHPVPRLSTYQAVERLNETDLPFRFFRHAATGRGAVLYRRLDGHYGLLASAP